MRIYPRFLRLIGGADGAAAPRGRDGGARGGGGDGRARSLPAPARGAGQPSGGAGGGEPPAPRGGDGADGRRAREEAHGARPDVAPEGKSKGQRPWRIYLCLALLWFKPRASRTLRRMLPTPPPLPLLEPLR
eukprot:478882-Prorocentrum_minimum.AAC.1